MHSLNCSGMLTRNYTPEITPVIHLCDFQTVTRSMVPGTLDRSSVMPVVNGVEFFSGPGRCGAGGV